MVIIGAVKKVHTKKVKESVVVLSINASSSPAGRKNTTLESVLSSIHFIVPHAAEKNIKSIPNTNSINQSIFFKT